MKKVLSVIICIVMMVVSVPYTVNAVSIKPKKASISSSKQISKSSVKVKWRKVSKASGYILYMKTNSGSYKKIKTTKSTSYNKNGLKVGKKYYFKLRAYRNYRGKKYYGKFSSVKKVTMKSYVYLTNVLEPYAYASSWAFGKYDNTDPLMMGGDKYYNSFYLYCNGVDVGDDGYSVYYNLKGKYSRFVFEVAIDGSENRNLIIECDDELTADIEVKAFSLPKKYIIDVKDICKLKLSCKLFPYGDKINFGNVKLYY